MTQKFVRIRLRAVVAAAALVAGTSAEAQIGRDWNSYSPNLRLQLRGCGAHSASGGVETFRVTCSSTGADNRAERRVEDDYSSGTRQFEGEVRVVSLGGTGISLKQTFMAEDGAFLMLAVAREENGRLFSVGNSGTLATGIIGNWIRINTIHDVSNRTHQVYVNGSLRFAKSGGTSPWYNKYGAYRIGSGRGPATVEWRNVRFWRDGSSSGGSTPTPTPTATPEPTATPTPSPTPTPTPSPTPTPCGDCGFVGYYRIEARHSGKVLAVQGASTAEDAAVVQLPYGGSATNDEWSLVSVGGGYYRIMNRNSGKAMAVRGASTATSIPIVQLTYGGSATNDEWRVNDLGTGYYSLINRNSGRAVDVKAGSTADNAVVQQSTPSGVAQQQFAIVSVP